ncbi:MAG: transposase [Verrucomicrobia bacterium]|jgi:hypothetical protein|nr:transposase [Verrucomicrobiota bacterium]
MNTPPDELTVREEFFAPLTAALRRSTCSRNCPDYTDQQHLESGVGRVIAHVVSGREWVQHLWMKFDIGVSVSNFFAALRSVRRLQMVHEVAQDVRAQADGLIAKTDDPLAVHSELDGFAVYASDGHTHGASAHEQLRGGKKRPVTHIYSLNLRTHTLIPLVLATAQAGRKREHELSALKRIGGDVLRMKEPTGVRVIHVYDPAIVDYAQWHKWKQGRGIYILTLEKRNSALITIGNSQWDRDDPRNIGVVADEFVGPSNGHMLRRITYVDPITGKRFSFLINEFTLPPGLIAFLYKLRWDVEKTFDEIKNKTYEQKAWAGNAAAKSQQALFISITHNLMRMLEMKLHHEDGITDQKNAHKRRARMTEDLSKAEAAGRTPNPLVTAWHRSTQRCCQFIRWLRGCLTDSTPWREALALLRPLMAEYLA